MKCVACGKEGTKKELLFSEDKQAYCVNPFTCNEHHPNSVPNIIGRGAAVKMFTEEELEDNFFELHHITPEMKERILKVATKPQSIRLSKYDIAHYLLELQDKRGLASISEAVRYCVLYTKKNMPIDAADDSLDVPRDESSDESETFEFGSADLGTQTMPVATEVRKGVKVVPKPSINVDWAEIDRQRKDEAATKDVMDRLGTNEDEDEFTF